MTRQLSPPSARMQNITGVAPASKGGTGGFDSESAATMLGGISIGAKGLNNGVATLTADIKVPLSQMPLSSVKTVTLKGPTEVAIGQSASFIITNFDSKTAYTVSTSAGTAAVSGNAVVFNAPATVQDVSLTINGRTITISVVAVRPIKPVIAVSDFGIGASAALILTAKAFAMLSGTNTHQSTDWEVSLSDTFTNTVYSSYNDTVNKLSISTTALTAGNKYYARARFKDSNGVSGGWSKVVSIVTQSDYKIDKFLSKVVANDRVANDQFGYEVKVSGDGKRLAVCSWMATNGSISFAGGVYIYVLSGSSWIFEAKLYPSDSATNDRFGTRLAFNFDGSRLAIKSASITPSGSAGAVYIFLRSGTTWIQEAKIMAADRAANDNFGSSLALSKDATRLAIGSYGSDISPTTNNGAVYIYIRTGITWSLEAKLQASDKASNDSFGYSVAMADDASRVFVGAFAATVSAVTQAGAVYVFTRSLTTWAQEAKLIAAVRAQDDKLGFSIACSSDGSRVVAGAIGLAAPTATDNAYAIVFTRTNSTWAQEVKLQADDRRAEDGFAFSLAMNADGTRIIVGAYNAHVSAVIAAGAAYIYSRTLLTWEQESKLTAIDKSQTAVLGFSVSMTADASRVVVSAHNDDPAGVSNAGSVYTFGT